MLTVLLSHGRYKEVLALFENTSDSIKGVVTFCLAIRAATKFANFAAGRRIHDLIESRIDLEKDAQFGHLRNLLICFLGAAGDMQAALTLFERARLDKTGDIVSAINTMKCLGDNGQFDKALSFYERHIRNSEYWPQCIYASQ